MTEEEFSSRPTASDVTVCAFALNDCVVEIESGAVKYLRAVHRSALELAVLNLFGLEIGGFWLTAVQLDQLRKLPECYPASEVSLVRRALDAYLLAQTEELSYAIDDGATSVRDRDQ